MLRKVNPRASRKHNGSHEHRRKLNDVRVRADRKANKYSKY